MPYPWIYFTLFLSSPLIRQYKGPKRAGDYIICNLINKCQCASLRLSSRKLIFFWIFFLILLIGDQANFELEKILFAYSILILKVEIFLNIFNFSLIGDPAEFDREIKKTLRSRWLYQLQSAKPKSSVSIW